MLLINSSSSLAAVSLLLSIAALCNLAQANKLISRGEETVDTKISCDNVRCGYGANCAIKNGKPICKCPSLICAQIYEPICGTDGVTYSNSCALRTATCKSNGAITKAKDGECPKSSYDESDSSSRLTPSGVNNDEHKNDDDHDANNDKHNYKEDKDQDQEHDKATKSNNKKGIKASKNNDHDDDKDSKEEYESVSTKPCKVSPPKSQTEDEPTKGSSDQQQKSCSVKPCTKILHPVCGSNGITYNNICMLNNAACKTQTRILKVKDEACSSNGGIGFREKCRLICQRARAPACSPSQLESGQTNFCLTPKSIRFVKRCQCSLLSTTRLPTTPSRNCPDMCPLNYEPVCGSNGQTFGNHCHLQSTSCKSPKPILWVHNGACLKDSLPGTPDQSGNTPRDPAEVVADADY